MYKYFIVFKNIIKLVKITDYVVKTDNILLVAYCSIGK